MNHEFDITIYGATGFTGTLATRYLSDGAVDHSELKLAIAGRNQEKLSVLAASCAKQPTVVVAASDDIDAIEAMVRRSKVVLNFAGPFALYAEHIIAACARQGRTYLDITGESPFVRKMLAKYQDVAEASGGRVIPFSGFDSVPADLMAQLALEFAAATQLNLDRLSAYYELQGGLNGGTLASILEISKDTSIPTLFDSKMLVLDPSWPPVPPQKLTLHYEPYLKSWSVPFVMAAVNQAVFQRSQWLRHRLGQPVTTTRYEEHQCFGQKMSALKCLAAAAALGTLGSLTTGALGRKILQKIGPKPGEGPSATVQSHAWFRAQMLGSLDGKPQVLVTMSRKGDPGNEITITMACEAAKLAAEGKFSTRLCGFLTPSVAFSGDLKNRLEKAGFQFSTQSIGKK